MFRASRCRTLTAWFRLRQALDASAPNAVNGQLVKLSAHLKVSSVYTSLAKSAARSYPQKILLESENASSAAQQLFRMPLPANEYEASQEVGYRTDMAFAALRFLNDRYSHVVEQRNDVVKEKDWANIIKREDRIEDGAIAIARAADAQLDPGIIYAELDRIAELVSQRVTTLEAGATGTSTQSADEILESTVASQADETRHNRYSLQEMADLRIDADGMPVQEFEEHVASFPVMPNGQPDNRHSLLEAAQRVADESQLGLFEVTQGAQEASSMELPESALAQSYAAKIDEADAATGVTTAKSPPPADLPVELRALNAVLFEELGFCGNRQDYYDPLNTMIHRVLETRTGNPITLSVVYLAVARRVGLALSGAECPSHFIVRGATASGEPYFVDVFNKGKVMSLESCKEMFLTARSALLDKKDLVPVSPVQVYSRMMRNLVNSHMILGNGDKALLWWVSPDD
jgi:regulator of sirC expression with transglutaminase-like and TPR domain